MYCEKCSRIVEEQQCPYCKGKKLREPADNDPCFVTEQDYIPSGILQDVLKQNGIPYLIKSVLGAGIAIRVGPVLDRSRFYVPFRCLNQATEIVEEVFSDKEGNEPEEETEGNRNNTED